MKIINITNHPVRTWSEEQRLLCLKELGGDEIIDLRHPNINPMFTTNQVKRIAEEIANQVFEKRPVAVVLQGESSFVYELNELLRKACVPSYAAAILPKENDEDEIKVTYRQYCDMFDEEIRPFNIEIGSDGVVINTTNHPSMFWDEKMRRDVLNTTRAAFVSDVGIPIVTGNMTSDEIRRIAIDCFERITLDFFEKPNIKLSGIICQGESSFCDAFVQLCQKASLPVYCSTSNRIVKTVNGKKASEFQYEALRKY